MTELEKVLRTLNDIRMDMVNHKRQYIGKVKRQEAIEALAVACIAISQIINYTDEKFENVKEFEPGHVEYIKDNEEIEDESECD